jgi:methyl-accepting chemotaxis protein
MLMAIPTIALEIRVRSRMATWRGLSRRTLPPSPENLQRAMSEIYAIPDYVFFARLQHWIAGSLILATWLGLAASIGIVQAVRAAVIGMVGGSLVCLVPHYSMVQRSRALIRHVGRLGPAGTALAPAIPQRRMGYRGRLMLLVLILGGAPVLLMADAMAMFAERGLGHVASIAEPAARQLAAASALAALRFDAIAIGALLVLVGLFVAAAAGTAVTEPIRRLADNAQRVAEGRLSLGEGVIAEDELGTLATAFGQMQQQIAEIIAQLRQAGVQISSATEQIVVTSSKQVQGAARQATALVKTSMTTEELARSANSIAVNAGEVADIAHRTRESAEDVRVNATSFTAAMERMRAANVAIADSVQELNGRVGQIGTIVEFINGVADKSDLLALNAELEGVKAGEVGRAFSLVANEMRRMAENVTRSTREIEELIEQIRDATTAAVQATESGTHASQGSAAAVSSMSEGLAAIVVLAGLTSEAVKTISTATQQQKTGTDQLASAMGDILGIAEETEAATQAILTATVDLVRRAKDLQDAVQRFQIDSPQA